jgi:hypothetical protein
VRGDTETFAIWLNGEKLYEQVLTVIQGGA